MTFSQKICKKVTITIQTAEKHELGEISLAPTALFHRKNEGDMSIRPEKREISYLGVVIRFFVSFIM